MTFNQLKYFITVAECLSFTEAAKCLFITQPALSRQIIAMEDELQVKLLVREKKTLKLTPGGSLLYNRFHDILKDYRLAVNEARTANLGYEGKLRIGFLDIYDISEIFPPIIRQFRENYAKIELSMERYSLGELPPRLYDGSLDLILTYGFSLFDQPELVTSTIQKFQSCIMINADHPLAHKENLTLADLKNEQFIQLEGGICEEGHHFILNILERAGIHPKMMSASKMEDIMLWVQTGNAVAITTNRTIEKQNPYVVIREIDMAEARGHDVTMAWRRENYNPAIAIFMELVERSPKKTQEKASPRFDDRVFTPN